MLRIAAILAGLVLAVFAVAPASAATIQTYELNGVTFNDGGTASGSFTIDLSTNTLVSSSIVTSFKNIVFVGGDYNGSFFDSFTATPAANLSLADWGVPLISGQLLSLNFALSDLSLASFAASGSETVYSGLCFFSGFVCGSRSIVSGTIDAVVAVAPTPLPAALPMLAAALGGMGFAGWRRKRQAAA
jgi:hypothetical protein